MIIGAAGLDRASDLVARETNDGVGLQSPFC